MLSCKDETSWEPGAARTTPAARDRVAEKEAEPVRSGRQTRMLGEFRVPVERAVSSRGRRRPEAEAGAGSSLKAESPAYEDAGTDSCSRSAGVRLLHGPVDHAPRGGGDPEALRDRVPPQPPLAVAERVGLELPEAGETCPGAGRGSHRPVE